LALDFPSLVWKPLAGLRTGTDDLRDMDQLAMQCLDELRHPEKNDLSAENFSSIIFENFTTTLSDGSKVELLEGGSSVDVTFENRLTYVRLVTKKRLEESARQISAIRQGLGHIIPLGALSLYTWKEVEIAVCGIPEVDVNQLRSHTKYEGYKDQDPVITMFWRVLEGFSQTQRKLFLRFASGRDRLPSEWELQRSGGKVLTISRVYSTDGFPTASTCFFTLSLPRYSNEDTLRKQLLEAITHCTAIDSDFDVHD